MALACSIVSFVRHVSGLGWLSALSVKHGVALEKIRVEWISLAAQHFAGTAASKLCSEGEAWVKCPVNAMLYYALSEPLKRLFGLGTKEPGSSAGFDDVSKKELVRIWLPVLLQFQKAEVLPTPRRSWKSKSPDYHFFPPAESINDQRYYDWFEKLDESSPALADVGASESWLPIPRILWQASKKSVEAALCKDVLRLIHGNLSIAPLARFLAQVPCECPCLRSTCRAFWKRRFSSWQ